MKTLFVETQRKFKESEINLNLLNKLPGEKISLAATIQYIGLIPKVKSYLKSKGKKVIIKKGAYYPGHILGCNSSAFNKSADTLLLITDGKFHALNNGIIPQSSSREKFMYSQEKPLRKSKKKKSKDATEKQKPKRLSSSHRTKSACSSPQNQVNT